MEHPGRVYLIGAGPGDPELITLKAARCLEKAEVVIHDRLVADGVLDLAPAGAERIFAGKATGNHHLDQDSINGLLAGAARRARVVARVKGGDPFIFGRGGEEAAFLSARGIPWEAVPGVTAAAGAAAQAGVPLTQRGTASGVRFVTGHLKNDGRLDLPWESLADPDTTLAVYMGLGTLEHLAGALVDAGLPPDIPTLAVARATLPDARRVTAPLAALPERVAAHGLAPPVIVLVGHVVGLAPDRVAGAALAGDAAPEVAHA